MRALLLGLALSCALPMGSGNRPASCIVLPDGGHRACVAAVSSALSDAGTGGHGIRQAVVAVAASHPVGMVRAALATAGEKAHDRQSEAEAGVFSAVDWTALARCRGAPRTPVTVRARAHGSPSASLECAHAAAAARRAAGGGESGRLAERTQCVMLDILLVEPAAGPSGGRSHWQGVCEGGLEVSLGPGDDEAAAVRWATATAGTFVPVVAMRTTSGLANGGADSVLMQASGRRGSRAQSLLQTGAEAAMIPGLQDILTMTMKLLLPPVMDPLMEKMNDHFSNSESQELAGDIAAATPIDTATKAEPQVRANIVALLPDAVAMAVRGVAPAAVADRVVAESLETLGSRVPSQAVARIHTGLLDSLGHRLSGSLGSLLERELGVSLAPVLSLSIPRAVVPAVTAALRLGGLSAVQRPPGVSAIDSPVARDSAAAQMGVMPNSEPWCRECYAAFNGTSLRQPDDGDDGTLPWQGCDVCTPAYRLGLAHYYGTYYSHYYGLFYARYYGVKTMLALEQVQHTPLTADAIKDARKANEVGRSSGPSGRPISPFGTAQPPLFF